jgi:hypothetical protein
MKRIVKVSYACSFNGQIELEVPNFASDEEIADILAHNDLFGNSEFQYCIEDYTIENIQIPRYVYYQTFQNGRPGYVVTDTSNDYIIEVCKNAYDARVKIKQLEEAAE